MHCSRLATAAAVALILCGTATQALAAPCAGFTDVQTTDTFCNAVQWLKNRQVTLGCGAGTTYCPGDSVTRASMALFMNRLGIAVTPRLVAWETDVPATATAPGLFTPFCATTPLSAVNYPQTGRVHGSVSVPATGPALNMFLVASLNGAPYVNLNFRNASVPNPNGQQNLSWNASTIAIPPGSTVAFAIGISNPAGAGTLNIGVGTCSLHADVVNANPTSAPFDE